MESSVKGIEIDVDVNRAIENGRRDFGESPNEILRRLLGIDMDVAGADSAVPRVRHPRSSGAYSTRLGTKTVEANSLKELLARSILVGERLHPGFIEMLSQHPTPKGRFVVARSVSGLYPRSPQLAEYAERLNEDWWFDTNVGRNQVGAYLTTFARLLQLSSIPTIQKRTEKTSLTLEDIL